MNEEQLNAWLQWMLDSMNESENDEEWLDGYIERLEKRDAGKVLVWRN
jgi:hypothetical protein